MRRAILQPGFVAALLLMLTACASIVTEPLPEGLTDQPPTGWSDRTQMVTAFQNWHLQGKLAVKQPDDSGTAVINQWRQQGDHYFLTLSSPFLGMGRTELNGVPGFLELTLPDGETYRSGDPQKLVTAATGWDFPVNALVWWIRGLAVPGDRARLLFSQSGKLAVLEQAGWEIRYDRWASFVNGLPALPARITALKGDKRIRLVITAWEKRKDAS